jgi:hypothetical protein
MPLPCMPGKVLGALSNAGTCADMEADEPAVRTSERFADPRAARPGPSRAASRSGPDGGGCPRTICRTYGSEGQSEAAVSIPLGPPGHSLRGFEVIMIGEAAAMPHRLRKLGQMTDGPAVSSTARTRERNAYSEVSRAGQRVIPGWPRLRAAESWGSLRGMPGEGHDFAI